MYLSGFQAVVLVHLLILGGCGGDSADPGPPSGATQPPGRSVPVYHFAVHPLYNPNRLSEAYQPLIDHLNRQIREARFVLEASMDYAKFERKYRIRKPEFLLPNPWQTLQAMQAGYAVIATAGDAQDFRGQIVVRRDGGITTPSDLKGRAVSYPSATALAACLMPQYFLHRQGLDIAKDIENRYVGSQESSAMNVFLKKTAAGGIWPTAWRVFQKDHPAEAAAMRIAWETEPLINNSVMARDDLPAEIRERTRACLVGLHETEAGPAILAGMETTRFIAATDRDYAVVRAYVDRFEREVRKVDVR